jgi:hypothetical protein
MGEDRSRRSAGFGVGVLEEDADDDDVYGTDDMRAYDRLLTGDISIVPLNLR